MLKKLTLTILTLLPMVAAADNWLNKLNPDANALHPLTAKRLWVNEGSVSPAIYSLTRFISRNCREYQMLGLAYPTPDIVEQCAFIEIFNIQEQILHNINNLDSVDLPSGQEWPSLFAGIVAPVFDFSAQDWNPYGLVANIILSQVAIEKGVKASLGLEGPLFREIEYPAIMASLFPADRLTYYLRASLATNCRNSFYDCRKIGELTSSESVQLLNQLYEMTDSVLSELQATKDEGLNLETWLVNRVRFKGLVEDLRLSGYSASDHLKSLKDKDYPDEYYELVEVLKSTNMYGLSLPPHNVVQAVLALMEVTEVHSLLRKLGYPMPQNISGDLNIHESYYTESIVRKIEDIKNLFPQ